MERVKHVDPRKVAAEKIKSIRNRVTGECGEDLSGACMVLLLDLCDILDLLTGIPTEK